MNVEEHLNHFFFTKLNIFFVQYPLFDKSLLDSKSKMRNKSLDKFYPFPEPETYGSTDSILAIRSRSKNPLQLILEIIGAKQLVLNLLPVD